MANQSAPWAGMVPRITRSSPSPSMRMSDGVPGASAHRSASVQSRFRRDADEALQLDVAFELIGFVAGPEDRSIMAARMCARRAVGPFDRVGGPYDEVADIAVFDVPFGKQPFAHNLTVVGGAGRHFTQCGIGEQCNRVIIAGSRSPPTINGERPMHHNVSSVFCSSSVSRDCRSSPRSARNPI